jgi:hypothetical protein
LQLFAPWLSFGSLGCVAALFMKTPDISQTPIVKRFGVRGAKLFAKIWFSIMYLALVAISAGFWIVWPEVVEGWRRIFVGCFVGALVVFAASLLTRMRLQYLAAIEQLEARGTAA